MHTHLQHRQSFSHLLTGLFVPHLSGGVKPGCNGQGWHPSFIPKHTHTPKTQGNCQSDLRTENHLSSIPVEFKTKTAHDHAHTHTVHTYRHVTVLDSSAKFSIFVCWMQEDLCLVFTSPWWSSGAVGNIRVSLEILWILIGYT